MSVLFLFWRRFSPSFILLASTLLTARVASQQEGDLRLSGYGASRLAGRLEIYLDSQWGTVCGGDDTTNTVAKVACRQLRLGHYIGQLGTSSLRYGIGNGSIWLENVSCNDNDDYLHILRCSYDRVGESSTCDHAKDLSVMCSGISTPYEGEVRLVGGAYASEGVAEMYLHRQWAQVCSTDMESGLADTICRQLGYTGVLSVRPLDNATGSFWRLSPSLSSSPHSCIKDCHNLSHSVLKSQCSEDLTPWQITCRFSVSEIGNVTSGSADLCTVDITEPEDGQVRLNGVMQTDQGRVEVFLHDEWGSLYMLGSEGATVVCKQLGYPTYVHSDPISLFADLAIPPFQGPQYFISCTGMEAHVNACTISTSSYQNHDDDAYVHCSPILWPFGSLRLVGGAGPFGQLQVSPGPFLFNWLCDAHFSMREANVACRQLGYSGALRTVQNSQLSDPNQSSLLSFSLHCSGEEQYLMECERRSVLVEVCRETLDAVAVQCGSTSLSNGWQVRLVPPGDHDDGDDTGNHGNSSEDVRSGIVEVMLEEGGEWGTVCADESVSHRSAHVMCRQLNFETVSKVTATNESSLGSGGGPRPVLLSSVQCMGFEERLDYCHHSLATPGDCTTIISVECSDIIPIADGCLRLVNSSSSAQPPLNGRLEIAFHGLWMRVCGLLFSQEAADVACRQLGFKPAANYCTNACFGSGSSDIIHFGEHSCHGDETSLLKCGISIHHADSCSHDDDVGLWCPPLDVVDNNSSSASLPPSSSLPPSLPSLAPSRATITDTLPQSTTTSDPAITEPVAPTKRNVFISEGIIYVVVAFLCLLLLTLIMSVTICCVVHKKKSAWVIQPQNGSYSDCNDQALSVELQENGGLTMATEMTTASIGGEEEEEEEGEGESEFDFDAVADSVEMKACAKAAEAIDLSQDLTPDRCSLSSSAGPPPQYHELDFLSHSLPGPGEETKELT